jgi:DNA-binding MarR family transcriptional regulator
MEADNDMHETVDRIAEAMLAMQRVRERTYARLAQSTNRAVDVPVMICLSKLIKLGPMSSGALAKAVCSDPSTISRQAAALVERGLVRREADAHDGRVTVLVVTERGHEVVEQTRRLRTEHFDRIMADWSQTEREEFADRLERFVASYHALEDDFVDSVREKFSLDERMRHPS